MPKMKELEEKLMLLKIENEKTRKETEKTRKENEKSRKESNERLAKLEAFLNKSAKEAEKDRKETKRLKKMIFGIGKSQGVVAEEFFENSIKSTKKVAGIQYDMMYKNLEKNTKRLDGEYDIVLVNGTELLIIEVKYNAHLNDLDKFLNVQVPKFKKLFPEYKDYKHNLAFASFHINKDFKKEALRNNVVILQRKGNLIETIVP